ncbi:MAG: RNase adapter RapZ [Pseudomonadota bacterium]|nr:RNase adapter RapZ [Pseudomonadota bacterium]
MRLIIVSGLSGSGKSVALHSLEDMGFYCIDNIPAALLSGVIRETIDAKDALYENLTVGVDARNRATDLQSLPKMLRSIKQHGIQCEVIFLHTEDRILLKRYRETRRKHPWRTQNMSLKDAINLERKLLSPVINSADLVIDTSETSIYDLRELLHKRLVKRDTKQLSIQIESFGFKHGAPYNADFVFDVRCLANPFWEPKLRSLNGKDKGVIKFLEKDPMSKKLFQDILTFLNNRIPEFEEKNRNYLTVALGCTGGQHRSVYLAEQLATELRKDHGNVIIIHSEISDNIKN